ncbi:C2 calcium-dependent domain-containing protein 6 [Orycteropus afer afer]|uniref:C2 calcium-dependent domain-containing protein 6 n=1 Tax=Orycteropus afer afer TaxID=1230840 RepID=A0A8B6ZEZ2_ORYAF|nr:C2 calcium-dependent domain-containing protein 6 [Orycteropus afer afer]
MELPEDAQRASTSADNRNVRLHSLVTAPTFQRSPYATPESMHSRGLEFSSRHPQEHGKMMPPRDQANVGPVHRLLNMLKKTLKGSENKETEVLPEMPTLVPFGDVVGCLAIHVKNCRHFAPQISLKSYYTNIFIRITVNNVVKCTKMCALLSKSSEKHVIKFDEVKYFSVQVPRRQEDVRNNVYLELMEYEIAQKYPLLLGSVQVHLYEIIQKGCFTEEFKVFNKNTFICRMEIEFMFSYGNFGFGFSHQLKPLQKIIEPSMFMNVAPPPERTDPVSNVIVPQPVEYPAFLSPDLNVTVGKPSKSNQPSVVRLEKLQQPPRERLEKMKKEYRNLSTWVEKSSYLEDLLMPVLEHETKRSSKILKSLGNDQLEEKTETSDGPLIDDDVKTTPKKPLENDKTLPNLILPTLKLSYEDSSDAFPPESDESEKQLYLLHTDSSLSIPSTTEENKIPPSDEYEYYSQEEKLKTRYSSLIKTDSSLSENMYDAFRTRYEYENFPQYSVLMQVKSYGQKNTNKKGKTTFNIKNNLDPLLRSISNNMSVRKVKDQDKSKCRNILSAEVIEHEDQDPPYPAHFNPAGPADEIWARGPEIITIKPLDAQLQGGLPNVSLSSSEGESSVTTNVDTCSLSKSLDLTSQIENLKQSMAFKSTLSKNLQDLLDQLFSKPEAPMGIEARKKSRRSPLLSVPDKPSSSLEDKVFGKIQDLKSCLPEKDILNSKSLLSQITKEMPTDSLSEGESGESTEVEREHISTKDLEAGIQDHVIKQIFTTVISSELEKEVKELCERKLNVHDQLPPAGERSLLPHNGACCEKKDGDSELSQSKSAINQKMQVFPVDTLLGSELIKVIELDKGHQESSLLDSEEGSPEEKPNYSTKEYSEIKIKTEPPSEHRLPSIPKETSCILNTIEFTEEGQNIPLQDSKSHSIPDTKTDLPRNGQRFYKEENELNTTLDILSNSLIEKLNESDKVILKSFLKHIFYVFFKYHQSERRRQPERELQRLIQYSFTDDTEGLEKIRENVGKADILDRKPILNPKLRIFLEELSESEIKHLKSELSKHIQHYLVERLSESGHITKEDLPKIYQNLCLMNEKSEPRRQNVFQEKYSEAVKEIISFISNFHNNFIGKHLEIKLSSFLSEILKNYFLENFSEIKLFEEPESASILPNASSLRTENASMSLHDSGHDSSRGSFGRRLEINTPYPLNKSPQNYPLAPSENELSNLKSDLGKHLQGLFIEKLSKSRLITKKQLEDINQCINLINSSSTPLKCMKTDLSFRNESKFMEEDSEKQNKYSKTTQKTNLQKMTLDRPLETELIRKKEKELFPLLNMKENLSLIREQKNYSVEGAKTTNLIKVTPSSNKNIQVIPLSKPSEKLTNVMVKNQGKEHDFPQFPVAENSVFKAETQDPWSWGYKSEIIQSNACFERTLKMKSIEKKEHLNIYKLTVQDRSEAGLSPYPRVPSCKIPDEDEESSSTFTFPSRQSHTLTHVNSEDGETFKVGDHYCQRLKGKNNNNKKQYSVTFAEYKKEMQTPYKKKTEIFSENCASVPESHSFKCSVLEIEKSLKPSLLPELFKAETLKPKVRKERDHVNKQKKPLGKIVTMLPTTLPPTRIHLRKSIPRTLIHWTARTTVHDCSDRFEDIPMASFKNLEKTKSRARLLGKSPDDNHHKSKYSARPYTAPEVIKRRKSHNGKCKSHRLVSAGLVHVNDTISNYEMHKTHQEMHLKENIEKCSLIYDIIQILNISK